MRVGSVTHSDVLGVNAITSNGTSNGIRGVTNGMASGFTPSESVEKGHIKGKEDANDIGMQTRQGVSSQQSVDEGNAEGSDYHHLSNDGVNGVDVLSSLDTPPSSHEVLHHKHMSTGHHVSGSEAVSSSAVHTATASPSLTGDCDD